MAVIGALCVKKLLSLCYKFVEHELVLAQKTFRNNSLGVRSGVAAACFSIGARKTKNCI